MSPQDLHDDGGMWRGLRVTGAPRCPPLHVQAGPGRRVRICSRGAPLLWAREAEDQYGYAYLREPPTRTSLGVLPPVGRATSRSTNTTAGSVAWLRHWATVVAGAVARGGNACQGSASTFVGPCDAFLHEGAPRAPSCSVEVPFAAHLERALVPRTHDFNRWSFPEDRAPLPMRAPASSRDRRVAAFRPLARDRTLAPIVLRWVAGLQRYLVLDGHDRLHAALLEGIVPSCIAVVDLAWAAPHVVTTRAWPLAGGVPRWEAEVRAELARSAEGDDVLLAS